MNEIYETMLRRHNLDNEDARRNAHYEVMQQITPSPTAPAFTALR